VTDPIESTDSTEPTAPFVRALQVGQRVPDFELETYDPATESFGEVRLEDLRREGRWTILFFYPADFTFV
jgi:peroxiredoxin (alkyl hydroperoxide reductase subunit C)